MQKVNGGSVPDGEIPSLFTGLFGLAGTGKTTIGLSFPGPIMFANCDRPAGLLIQQLSPDIEVYYVPMVVDADTLSASQAKQYLMQFDGAVRTALSQCKTFFLDGESRFLDIVRVALLPGGGEDAIPRDYAAANEYLNNHFARLAASGLQTVISTTARAVWTGAKTKTDYLDREGFKGTRTWMNTELYVYCPEWTLPRESLGVEAGVGMLTNVNNVVNRTHWSKFSMCKTPGKEGLVGTQWQDMNFMKLYKMVFGREYGE